eukprot:CAMPEP_0172444278 /NCGR_PEP_ID=MMETSP1065-20121228/4338_1 /TAXON_ID=265537 /ORGANISM="Amphiprora paludosa, Strain CCMP125" /LENGTH=150 /DNA_ID=CAMNT_0013194745 /DNA_START=278 /DNA_END=730 /DNA_ORIENTATION=+
MAVTVLVLIFLLSACVRVGFAWLLIVATLCFAVSGAVSFALLDPSGDSCEKDDEDTVTLLGLFTVVSWIITGLSMLFARPVSHQNTPNADPAKQIQKTDHQVDDWQPETERESDGFEEEKIEEVDEEYYDNLDAASDAQETVPAANRSLI